MRHRQCTSLLPAGNGRTKCGKSGQCTRVRRFDADGGVEWERWVCWACRQKMRLPEEDVDFDADGSVFDHMTGERAPEVPGLTL